MMLKFPYAKKGLKILLGIGILYFIYSFFSYFVPLILAFVTALILEPLVGMIQKYIRAKSRLPAVTIVFVMFLLANALILYYSVTYLVKEAVGFFNHLPYYMASLNQLFEKLIVDFNRMIEGIPNKELIIQEMKNQSQLLTEKVQSVSQNVIPTIATWVQKIPHFLFVAIVFLITLFLVSLDLPNIKENFYSHFKEENAQKIRFMLQRLSRVFTGFFKMQFLVSIVIFIVSLVGLLFISKKNALLLAFIIWVIDVIPFIGSIIFLGPWAVYEFIAGDLATGIKVSILAVILLIIRRTLEPKIMGDQIGLPALPTLISIYLGLSIMGVIGLILGPLLVIAYKSAKEVGLIKMDFKI